MTGLEGSSLTPATRGRPEAPGPWWNERLGLRLVLECGIVGVVGVGQGQVVGGPMEGVAGLEVKCSPHKISALSRFAPKALGQRSLYSFELLMLLLIHPLDRSLCHGTQGDWIWAAQKRYSNTMHKRAVCAPQ